MGSDDSYGLLGMRFHVVSLPNTQTTKDYSWSPYTQKVRKFTDMMHSLGHEVVLYAGEANEALCTEHVVCITEEERSHHFPQRWPGHDPSTPGRKLFMSRVIEGIAQRRDPGDFLCLIEGIAQRQAVLAFPSMIAVEFGVGYENYVAPYRVFESYAWMHTIHGMRHGAYIGEVSENDIVIPNSFEVDDFPEGDGSGDYLLYVGRLTERKGLRVVETVAKRTGLPIVVAGEGDEALIPDGADYYGYVDPADRAKLMGAARCIICPTRNIEPFGGTAVEAQLCGTPAITSDWGAYVETVEHDLSGFRCRTEDDFCRGVMEATRLDRASVRHRAIQQYSTEQVRHAYQDYFDRIATLGT